jgi:alpha-beta hydrolase superfamily lysophospholipase
MNKTFLMVHGSWHGGWAWEGVMSHLSKNGYHVQAPTLPGHGPGVMRQGFHTRSISFCLPVKKG